MMKLIDLEDLSIYTEEVRDYFLKKLQESFTNYTVVFQEDSLDKFPETGDENAIYILTTTNEAYRWSEEYKRYYSIGINWHFVTTTYDDFQNLSEKYDNTLYFLTNGQLYHGSELVSNVKVIQGDFPDTIDATMIGNFCVSLTTGEIKYAGSDGYVNISEIMTQNIVLSEKNLKILVDKIAEKKTITMPKLEVNGNLVVWTPSNVEEIEVFVPLEK